MITTKELNEEYVDLICTRLDEEKSISRKEAILRALFPDVGAYRLRIFIKILFVTFLFTVHSADVPDEWWQCNEIAYQVAMRYLHQADFPTTITGNDDAAIVTGIPVVNNKNNITFEERFGAPSWEWHPSHQIRSFVHPAPIAVAFVGISYLTSALWSIAFLLSPGLISSPDDAGGLGRWWSSANGLDTIVVRFISWLEPILYYLVPKVVGCIVACALHMSTVRVAQLLFMERHGINPKIQLGGQQPVVAAKDLLEQRKRIHAVFRVTSLMVTSCFMFAYTAPRMLSNVVEALALMYAFEELGKSLLAAQHEEVAGSGDDGSSYVEGPYRDNALSRKRVQEQELNRLLKESLRGTGDTGGGKEATQMSVWSSTSLSKYWAWGRLLTVAGVGCCLRCTFAVPVAVVLTSFIIADMKRGAKTTNPSTAAPKKKDEGNNSTTILALQSASLAAQRLAVFLLMAMAAVLFWCGLQISIDSIGYSLLNGTPLVPVFTLGNFFKFNFLSGNSAFFGSHPFHWYFTVATPANLGSLLLFVVILLNYHHSSWKIEGEEERNGGKCAEDGSPQKKEISNTSSPTSRLATSIVLTCLVTITFLSLLAHKEMRFVFPVTTCPAIALIIGRLLPDWAIDGNILRRSNSITTAAHHGAAPPAVLSEMEIQRRKIVLVALRSSHTLCKVSTLGLLAFFGWGFKSGPAQVVHALRRGTFTQDILSTPESHRVISVHILGGCYTLPGPSMYHIPITTTKLLPPWLQELSVHSISCADMDVIQGPQGNRRTDTEHDYFLRNPAAFIQYAYEGTTTTSAANSTRQKMNPLNPKSLRGVLGDPLLRISEGGQQIIRHLSNLQSTAQPITSSISHDATFDSDIVAFHRSLPPSTNPRGKHPSILLPPSSTQSSNPLDQRLPRTTLPDLFVVFSSMIPPTANNNTATANTTAVDPVNVEAAPTSLLTPPPPRTDDIRDFLLRNHYTLLESFFHTVVVVDEGTGHWLEVWGKRRR